MSTTSKKVTVSGCLKKEANGEYFPVLAMDEAMPSFQLGSHALTPLYLYKLSSSNCALFMIEFPNRQHPNDRHHPLQLWLLCQYADGHSSNDKPMHMTITKCILAKVPRISQIAPAAPPQTQYTNITSISINDIDSDSDFNASISRIFSVTNKSRATVSNSLRTHRYSIDDKLDTKDCFDDPNIRNACITDIHLYSTYHSYYKHLSLEGSKHICVPMLYGQVRGYDDERRKVGQIRWHVVNIENRGMWSYDQFLKKHGYDPRIIKILEDNAFVLNCCLDRDGNWSIMNRRNEGIQTHFKQKYPNLTSKIDVSDKFYYHRWASVVSEESDAQVEDAVLCVFRAYDQICEYLNERCMLTVHGFARKAIHAKSNKFWKKTNESNVKSVPTEIILSIVSFIPMETPLATLDE